MAVYVDHYAVLGLASEKEWAKLSEKEITKAFKLKALVLHPDKRRDDPSAHENFIKLSASYDVLKNERKRKLFVARKMRRKEEEESLKRKHDLDHEKERFAAAVRKYEDAMRSVREKVAKNSKFKRDQTSMREADRKYMERVDAMRARFGYEYPMKNVRSPVTSYGGRCI